MQIYFHIFCVAVTYFSLRKLRNNWVTVVECVKTHYTAVLIRYSKSETEELIRDKQIGFIESQSQLIVPYV